MGYAAAQSWVWFSPPQHRVDWGVLMAGTVIATFPTVALFLAAQRYFVRGIALTGIKG